MQELLEPIRTESLKELFIKRFEELILSGKFPIGQKLPSERELALQLNVSRPVANAPVAMSPQIPAPAWTAMASSGSSTLKTLRTSFEDPT